MPETPPLVRVALLALPESFPAVLYSLHELFGAVGQLWSSVTGEPETARCRFAPVLVSRDGAPLRSPAGSTIAVEAALDAVPQADIVIVTDLGLPRDFDPRGQWPEEVAWVSERYAEGAIVCSVCSGSIFLAEAGLLNGLEATSHWSADQLFRTCYPRVILRPERILAPAGPEHRIVTAGGASTWTDLGLYLLARFAGETEARRMARLFVIGDKASGQLPFAVMARPRQHDDGAIAAAQVWIAEHYATSNPVSHMAAIAGMTERTFARRFRRATGYSPVEYVQALRLEEAKQMLETTDARTDAIAEQVGYTDAAFFRRIFKRSVGLTPSRYRRQFAAVHQGPLQAARSPSTPIRER